MSIQGEAGQAWPWVQLSDLSVSLSGANIVLWKLNRHTGVSRRQHPQSMIQIWSCHKALGCLLKLKHRSKASQRSREVRHLC